MVLNKKVTGKAVSMPVGLGVGLAVSLSMTLLFVAVIAHLILGEKLEEEAIGYGAMIVVPLAAAIGALAAAGVVKRRWMVVCIGSGALYFLSLLSITAFFFGGQYDGVGITALLIVIGVALVGAIGLRGDKRTSKKKRRYRSR